jgi:hypothetical protein
MREISERKVPRSITHPIQLAVEGSSDLNFFIALLRRMNIIDQIQIQDYEGKDNLEDFLLALKDTGDFNTVISIGVVRDADADPSAAFNSVCSALRDAELYQPSQPEKFEGTNPRIGVLILPNANECGMLETLCLQSVSNDPSVKCIDDYFDCLKKVGFSPKIMDKAKIQAFLASRERTIWLLGVAAQCGYWQWDSPAFEHVKLFLNSLIS